MHTKYEQTIPSEPDPARPSLAVFFRCSNQYLRVFRDPTGRLYIARCPRCMKQVRFAVGPGGTSRRFFEVSC
ncbi:MAG: hypothetical protein HRU70_12605 [Phycisphaeraceae bacterium]|nr:MAG: hypothetical protein HRU70_12605 [Phycisphaeraceae bacterium]